MTKDELKQAIGKVRHSISCRRMDCASLAVHSLRILVSQIEEDAKIIKELGEALEIAAKDFEAFSHARKQEFDWDGLEYWANISRIKVQSVLAKVKE